MSSPEEYKNNLLKFDLQSFLERFKGYTALKLKDIFPDTYRLLAAQLSLYPKAINKLPAFTSKFCYMTQRGYEQSSSEALAGYKTSLVTSGDVIIDLSAGLGIDDIAFSKVFSRVIAVDTDNELNLLAEINNTKLGIKNIRRISAYAEEFIKICSTDADLIYIDADRRTAAGGKRSVTLHDSSPDIPAMLNRLFEISDNIMLKLSPLIDITYLTKKLPCIDLIRVVSLQGEVKEILVMLNRNNKQGPEIISVDVDSAGVCTEFKPSRKPKSNSPGKNNIFISAGASLVKAGLVKDYANENGFKLLNQNSPYMTAEALPGKIFGKSYSILHSEKFSKSGFKKYINAHNLTKANLSAKNFPVKAAELKKTFGIKDGGEDHFFFTSMDDKTKMFFHCKAIRNE